MQGQPAKKRNCQLNCLAKCYQIAKLFSIIFPKYNGKQKDYVPLCRSLKQKQAENDQEMDPTPCCRVSGSAGRRQVT